MEQGAEGEFGIENADFAPESDAGKGHRLRNAEIAPGRGLLSGWRVAVGFRSGKIDPARPSGRALGIKMLDSNPGRALEQGAEGEFGIENADFAPECDAGKRHRLRNP